MTMTMIPIGGWDAVVGWTTWHLWVALSAGSGAVLFIYLVCLGSGRRVSLFSASCGFNLFGNVFACFFSLLFFGHSLSSFFFD
jgi:hypothetical protein